MTTVVNISSRHHRHAGSTQVSTRVWSDDVSSKVFEYYIHVHWSTFFVIHYLQSFSKTHWRCRWHASQRLSPVFCAVGATYRTRLNDPTSSSPKYNEVCRQNFMEIYAALSKLFSPSGGVPVRRGLCRPLLLLLLYRTFIPFFIISFIYQLYILVFLDHVCFIIFTSSTLASQINHSLRIFFCHPLLFLSTKNINVSW